jgi:hypothetical protein
MGALQHGCDQIESAVMHATAPLVLGTGWAGTIDSPNKFNAVRMIWDSLDHAGAPQVSNPWSPCLAGLRGETDTNLEATGQISGAGLSLEQEKKRNSNHFVKAAASCQLSKQGRKAFMDNVEKRLDVTDHQVCVCLQPPDSYFFYRVTLNAWCT